MAWELKTPLEVVDGSDNHFDVHDPLTGQIVKVRVTADAVRKIAASFETSYEPYIEAAMRKIEASQFEAPGLVQLNAEDVD